MDLPPDPIWQPLDRVPARITRDNLPRGQSVTVTARLRYAGAIRPAGVNFGAPAWLRYALLVFLLGGTGFLGREFWRREKAIGRFEPLVDPASIDRRWLDEHLLAFPPEVVGAAWDDKTAAAEVAALIARLAQEGKLTSRVDKDGELELTLLHPRNSFEGYEASLVKSLFVDGDTTSTSKIKAHYKSTGFDPVSKIRDPLQERLGRMGESDAPEITRKETAILAVAGLVLMAASGTVSATNGGRALGAGLMVLVFYLAGLAGAIDYRRRLSSLAARSLLFVPAILLIMAVPANLLVRGATFRLHLLMLGGTVLLALALVRSLLNLAKSRQAGERLENRRRLTAAREYFARELSKPNPALDDAWFPYVVAFGLGPDADRWFHSFGGKSADDSSSSTTSTSSSSGSSSYSGASTGSGWSGFGGGRSGGGGATGAWAMAATTMAAGVASPSSSSSGGSSGGGSSSGGSSGGGGGGGW